MRPAARLALGIAATAAVAGVERLLALFRATGLEPQVQEAFACGPYGVCARVRNVLARIGEPGRKAVLLSAHHDSVSAGPGASDDLSGVAALLESARALRAGPPTARPVILLVTDCEETGLLGAAAFAEQHPWAREVGAVVNLEARGTEGPSLLFETPGEAEWVPRAARGMRHPNASSLFAAVYRVIPNDTDFTVLARAGLSGVNLAFGFGAVRYHTPRDDLDHLDRGSLQHQGENALALARALAAEDLERARRRPAVFFDVLGSVVVSWPESAAPWIALVAALGVLAAVLPLRREGLRAGPFLAGLAAALAAPLVAAIPALAAYLALRHGALPRPFVAHPGPFVAACWAAGAGGALLAAALAGRRAGAAGLLAGAGALFALFGLALAASIPGASHLAVVPALAFAAFGGGRALARSGAEGWALAASIGPAAAAGIVLFPLAVLLPPFLGIPAGVLVAALVALAVLPLAPLAAGLEGRARFAPAIAAFAVAFVLAGVAAVLPHATADAPERLSIAYHEQDGKARWLVEPEHEALPAAMRSRAAFSERLEPAFPWAPRRGAFAAPATPLGLAAPRAEVISAAQDGDVRRVRLRLVSPRGAPVLLLSLPPSADVDVTVDGSAVPPPAPRMRWWLGGGRIVGSLTAPPQGIELGLAIRGAAPIEATLLDESLGLPPSGADLALSRPASAVPSREGDLTFASTRVRI